MKTKWTIFRNWIRVESAFVAVIIGALSLWCAPRMLAAPDNGPCSANSETRRFDSWLGEWSVTYPGAPVASSSKVYRELGQCVLVENWSAGKNHEGINIFAYSSDDGHWHGMFADNEGRVHVFEGKVAGGSAEFLGPSRGSNGASELNRIRVVRRGPDQVEQTWEKSSDNGATWKTVFSGQYSRKKR